MNAEAVDSMSLQSAAVAEKRQAVEDGAGLMLCELMEFLMGIMDLLDFLPER